MATETTASSTTSTESTPIVPVPTLPRLERAHHIIQRNMLWSAGAGLIPIPLAEAAAITAVQLKLIKELTDLYETPFRQDLAKSAVMSLIGGLGSVAIGKFFAATSLRFIPVVGLPFAVASVPVTASGVTYAIGKVFAAHFETGGTLLNFDAQKMREHFRTEFEAGVKEAKDLAAKTASKVTVPGPAKA
jgi:uncharacterized protein (DUF697 family)